MIYLSDSAADVTSKVQTMMTDPARQRSDPGNPDICPVFDLHVSIVRQRSVRKLLPRLSAAGIGCLDCKRIIRHMVEDLGPLHEKRAYYTAHPDDAMQVLVAGSERAQQVAQQTMAQVRDAVHI